MNQDPLLECIGFVARRFGQPYSREAARAGLPLAPAENLTPELFVRAAAQCGLKAEAVAQQPSAVSSLVVPFVALMKDGTAAVVIALDKQQGTASLVIPARSPEPEMKSLAAFDALAAGGIYLLAPDERRAEALEHDRGREWFWGSMRRLWPSWTQVAIAALVINALGLAVPVFVMSVYDRVLPTQSMPTLWALTSGVILALLFDVALRQLRAVVLDEAGGLLELSCSAGLFRQALALPMQERKEQPGALASRIREFETVREFFASSSIVAFTDLLFVGIILLAMFALVGNLALVPLAALPLVIGISLVMQWPVSRAIRTAQVHATRRHAVLIESLGAIETVKGTTAEGTMQRRWEEAVAAHARALAASRFWSSLNVNLIAFVQQLVSVGVVVWGVFLSGEGAISVGGIIAASMLSGRVLSPLSNIAMVLARGEAAREALASLEALMARPRENEGTKAGAALAAPSLEFRDVSFTYPEAPTPSLSNVTFKLEPGERVGILGRVGSGKTTLAKLADGLWSPSSGLVLAGGREIRSVEAAELRAYVGYLPQDIELFSGTVFDNLVVGAPDAPEADIVEACAIAGVTAFAARHPAGLKMHVGERGRALSGGQRQAVALARTLIRNPRILVLDEPSSALDSVSETDLVRRLKAWADKTGATLLINSQRLSMLALCDRLLVLDQGRLVADGPKAEILARLSNNAPAAGRNQQVGEPW